MVNYTRRSGGITTRSVKQVEMGGEEQREHLPRLSANVDDLKI